jgi:hypothetical protein
MEAGNAKASDSNMTFDRAGVLLNMHKVFKVCA